MDFCLYDPQQGYYATQENIFGPEGDYYTSAHTHRLFAQTLADAFLHYSSLFGELETLHLVELGPGDGSLGAAVLERIREQGPDLFRRLSYLPVEREDDLPTPIRGVVFSNEFFDALPVHRVRVRGDQLREIYVQGEAAITEVEGEISDPRIPAYLEMGYRELEDGYQYEVNLRLLEKLEELDRCIDSAVVVTIDYGYDWEEYRSRPRAEGTLLCYHRHRVVTDPYLNPGRQDITAHLNFDVMSKKAGALGWVCQPLRTQRQFLIDWGLERRLLEEESRGASQPGASERSSPAEISAPPRRNLRHHEGARQEGPSRRNRTSLAWTENWGQTPCGRFALPGSFEEQGVSPKVSRDRR